MNKAPRIFGIGQGLLDYIGLIPAYPPPDVKCEFTHLLLQGGGPVATALIALKRWGLDGYMAGVVGNDDFGASITSSLTDEGIDTGGPHLRHRAGLQCRKITRPRRVGCG